MEFTAEQLLESTIGELQTAMQEGHLTSEALVYLYLERIAALNKKGPALNAVLEINPDAIDIARGLDLERLEGGPRGPLHGIPVLLKDNIDTGDHLHTSAGSLALADSYAAEDAFVAAQLRKAGAVILGKTNMTEWANFMTYNMPSGYSSRGGQVLNPYGPGKFDVGGSSSGSGSAIAANFATVSVGTETSGSILSPASSNSIVGIKPTVGLISRTGIIPIAHSQDTAGPMARTVTDAAILLGAMVGLDERDPATWSSAGRAHTDYTAFLDKDGLKGARIGVARQFYERLPEEQLAVMERAIEEMRAAGAEIIDPVEVATAKEAWDMHVLLYEFKADLNAYLGKLAPHIPVHSLADVIAFNDADPVRMLRYDQKIMVESEATSGTLADHDYLESRLRDVRNAREKGIDAVMAEHRLDALLFPNNYGAGMPARAGYPSITVPAGYTAEGQPVGVTFTGLAWSEPALIRLGYGYEQVTGHRVGPRL